MSQRRADAQAAHRIDDADIAAVEQVEEPALEAPDAPQRAARAGEVRHIVGLAPGTEARVADGGTSEEALRHAAEAHELARTLEQRIRKVERQNRWLKVLILLVALGTGGLVYFELFPEGVIVQKTLMESREIKLLDNNGNARLFLRMYSRVPVLQIFDSNGKPRMSLGLRFDDTPFIDLSDKRGNTRATFEMTEEDAPALRLFDEHGNTTFKIN
ncbi:MAG: hypothetical protein H6983_14945 [Ectothiorhodospiraceae bacterium]|nr:hypothetical protein [Chromatiales bacterium]MCP5155465.1 hypothetical protein [Ectothiorhodospiraceae bacterium]